MLGLARLPHNCMVYINTLMLQRVLGEPIWLERMGGVNEQRALTPLFWGSCEPVRHIPARHDRPPAPRSTFAAKRRGPIAPARRLTLRELNRYFASGDTNVGSVPG